MTCGQKRVMVGERLTLREFPTGVTEVRVDGEDPDCPGPVVDFAWGSN